MRLSFVRWPLVDLSCSRCTGNARIYAATGVWLLQRAGQAVQMGRGVTARAPHG